MLTRRDALKIGLTGASVLAGGGRPAVAQDRKPA
jgi:hypothetical protein